MTSSTMPYLDGYLARHPAADAQDILKLCYQAAFGGEHLLTDVARARAYFDAEYADTPPRDVPLCEWISPEIVRIDLGAWKYAGLPGGWLFSLFAESAALPHGSEADLDAYIAEAAARYPAFAPAFDAYRREGIRPLHHSDSYRDAEQPHYRVLHRESAELIPFLQALAAGDTSHIPPQDAALAAHLSRITGKSITSY